MRKSAFFISFALAFVLAAGLFVLSVNVVGRGVATSDKWKPKAIQYKRAIARRDNQGAVSFSRFLALAAFLGHGLRFHAFLFYPALEYTRNRTDAVRIFPILAHYALTRRSQ